MYSCDYGEIDHVLRGHDQNGNEYTTFQTRDPELWRCQNNPEMRVEAGSIISNRLPDNTYHSEAECQSCQRLLAAWHRQGCPGIFTDEGGMLQWDVNNAKPARMGIELLSEQLAADLRDFLIKSKNDDKEDAIHAFDLNSTLRRDPDETEDLDTMEVIQMEIEEDLETYEEELDAQIFIFAQKQMCYAMKAVADELGIAALAEVI
jgi:hypothetical protein